MSTETTPRTSRELVNRLWTGWPFDDGTWAWPASAPSSLTPVRVEELVDDGQVVIRAELPGVDPADIDVEVDQGVLTLRAERHERAEESNASGYRTEFRYGSFERRVRLPQGTSAEVVSATYRDGVLEVRMPAPASVTPPRRIEVERA
jgi:HSP20 family protein